MPEILDRCVQHLIDKGYPEENAWPICRASLDMAKKGEDEKAYLDRSEEMAKKDGMKKHDLQTFDIPGVEVFAAGTWNGDKYTVEDLDEMVAAFNETKDKVRPFLKLGHEEAQNLVRESELPAVGWISNLYRSGEKLLADFTKVPKQVYELIKAGAYRKVSSEIFWNIQLLGKKFKRMLKAVALLGAEMPAVSSLDDIMALYKAELQGEAAAYGKDTESRTYRVGVHELITEEERQMEERIKQLETSLSESEKKLAEAQAELKKHQDQQSSLSEQVKKLTEEVKSQQIENRRLKVNKTIDDLIGRKKIVPAQREELFAMLMGPNGDGQKYTVGEKQFGSIDEVVAAFIEKGQEVNLPTQEGSETGEPTGADLHEAAQKYEREHKVSYREALQAVAREREARR